jgi:hypothetical protein
VLISQQRSGFQAFTTYILLIHGHACATPSGGLSKTRISAATYWSIRFLATPTCHNIDDLYII